MGFCNFKEPCPTKNKQTKKTPNNNLPQKGHTYSDKATSPSPNPSQTVHCLVTKHLNSQAYGWHSHSNPHSHNCMSSEADCSQHKLTDKNNARSAFGLQPSETLIRDLAQLCRLMSNGNYRLVAVYCFNLLPNSFVTQQ